MTLKLNDIGKILRDYFDVTYRVINLILNRLKYRISLNCEAQFHSVDLSKILIEFYVSISKVLDEPYEYSAFGVFGENS